MNTAMSNLSDTAQDVLDAMWFDHFETVADKRSLAVDILRVLLDKAENFYDPSEGKTAAVREDAILAIIKELEQSDD